MELISPIYAAADDPPKIEGLFDVVDSVLSKLTPVAVILFIAMFVVGGYMWIVSGGNPESTKKAQGTMTWALIGFIFIFLIKFILSLVTDFITS